MPSLETAITLYQAGRPAEAAAECRALIQSGRRDADTLNLLGVALFSGGDAGGAAVPLADAVRMEPGHVAARINLAILLQHRQDWSAAEGQLGVLGLLDPSSGLAFGRLGTVRQEQGDLDGSVRALTRAVRLDPRSGLGWFNLASVRMLAGLFEEAVAAFRHALADDPAGALAHAQLGEMLLRLGRIDAAAAVFRRALRLDPQAGNAAHGLVRCNRYRATIAVAGAAAGTPAGGIVVRGPFESATGYGHFCQRLIRTLRARAVPLEAIGVIGPESWPDGTLDRPMPARAVVNCLIPLAVERLPGRATVTFSMFEGTRIPPAWRRMSEHSDLIVVPTESSRLAWMAQGFPEDRLRLCPLGVDPAEAGNGGVPTLVDPQGRLVSNYRHRFLNVSDFIPRKNIDGLLRVWLRATAATDDAVLILKLGKGSSPVVQGELGALLQGAERAAGRRLAEAAPVMLIDRLLADEEMTGLYRAATHYWSLSHGEGWDLPMSKAGAMGLGLIAPAHSAYLDYLDGGVARLIPSSVGPARLPGQAGFYPPFHGLDWWVPDEEAAAAILAGIIRGGDRLPSARDHLLGRFTWERSADRLLAILDEAGLR